MSEVITDSIEIKEYPNGHGEVFQAGGHQIELISFKLNLPLPPGMACTDNSGWIFRITKTSNLEVDAFNNKALQTYCLIDKDSVVKCDSAVEFSPNNGESLDAVEAYNKDWSLHIGTEDAEIHNSRAQKDDWFPRRLADTVGLYTDSITDMVENGLITTIPQLKLGEKIYVHYLTAYNPAYNDNISSWFAVDQFKHELEQWIGLD